MGALARRRFISSPLRAAQGLRCRSYRTLAARSERLPRVAGAAGVKRLIDAIAVPALHVLAPETAHRVAIEALKRIPLKGAAPSDPRLSVAAFGLRFPNPLGMAAGFDKNGEVVDALFALGFGFAEIGTITPLPQAGNARPRLFRLARDAGIINRLGFNNDGYEAVRGRLLKPRSAGILGINIGANKNATDRRHDYVAGVARFCDVADYVAINISSPNTPGLRELHERAALDDLLARLMDARNERITQHGRRPILLKISPDLALSDLDDVVDVARRRRVDGMIVSNTTLSRPGSLQDRTVASEVGGLSGRPLFNLSTRMLASTYLRVENQFPLVGVGGISDGGSAFEKIRAGATLLQLYSALVFAGMGLAQRIKDELLVRLEQAGHDHCSDAIGTNAKAWAETTV
jgi:dihydroorotate dehydrogenase